MWQVSELSCDFHGEFIKHELFQFLLVFDWKSVFVFQPNLLLTLLYGQNLLCLAVELSMWSCRRKEEWSWASLSVVRPEYSLLTSGDILHLVWSTFPHNFVLLSWCFHFHSIQDFKIPLSLAYFSILRLTHLSHRDVVKFDIPKDMENKPHVLTSTPVVMFCVAKHGSVFLMERVHIQTTWYGTSHLVHVMKLY